MTNKNRVHGAVAAALVLFACSSEPIEQPDANRAAHADEVEPFVQRLAHPRITRYPIVLVHAFNASAKDSWNFKDVADTLGKHGYVVVAATVPPFAGSDVRAKALLKYLQDARELACKGKRDRKACLEHMLVHIIGHSQGGLDAIYAVTRLGFDYAASITTIGTPHRGTPIGDEQVRKLDQLGQLDPKVANELATLYGFVRDGQWKDADLKGAFKWLSEKRYEDAQSERAKFQKDGRAEDLKFYLPDPNGRLVLMQSWAGIASPLGHHDRKQWERDLKVCEGKIFGPEGVTGRFLGLDPRGFMFEALAPLFANDDDHQPNDGHIPVASAKWRSFRGCVPAHHLDLVGHRTNLTEKSHFDHLAFYEFIADDLAGRGM
jgi:triacylglycerol esterase/lipase EstA (alpha/beta hydrolase family)